MINELKLVLCYAVMSLVGGLGGRKSTRSLEVQLILFQSGGEGEIMPTTLLLAPLDLKP